MSEYTDIINRIAESKLSPKVPLEENAVRPDYYQDYIDKMADKKLAEENELMEIVGKGLTFGIGDIFADRIEAEKTGKDLDIVEYEREQRREAYSDKHPNLSIAAELFGAIPTGGAIQGGLKAAGVVGLGKQAAIEGALYGAGTEGPIGAAIGGVGGGVLGRVLGAAAGGELTQAAKTVIKKAERDTAIRKVKAMAGMKLTPEEIEDEIVKLTTRRTIEKNRFQYDDYQEWEAALKEARNRAAKAGKDPDKVVMEKAPPEIIPATLGDTYEYMMKTFGLSSKEVGKALKKMGGVRFDDGIHSIDDLIQADKLFTGGMTGRTAGPIMAWYERNFTPMTEILRRYYSPQFAAVTERVWERTMRHNANFMDNMVYPMQNVIKFAEVPENKALLLDLHHTPSNLKVFRDKMVAELAEEDVAAFDNWWKYVEGKSSEARKLLFKPQKEDDKGWDIFFMHSEKRGAKEKLFATSKHDPKYDSIDALRERSRKPAFMMEADELADYMNPILAHSKYVMDNEVLIEGAKKYGLPPSLAMDGTTSAYFKQLQKRIARDTGDEAAAEEMANMVAEAYKGSRRAPPAPVRAFMNLSYAGTLAQFKSAVLNLHDIAVSMVNNGVTPTLRALFRRTDQEFGNTVRQMMGEQNFGEFVREFDRLLVNPTGLEKISWGTKKISDGAMFISGFAYMDRVGKGVVLRSAVEAARDSAKAGRFMSEYADFFIDSPMAGKVAKLLQSDIPVAQWDRDAAAIIEDIAFSKLGEQQLITAIGRPLGYLNHPMLRPLYAMTGFAIKQQALLRRNVVDEMRKGNYKKASQYAAKYAAYAGLGYGFINETRNAVFKGDDFQPEDVMLGAVDQIAAALTLNRLGDDYSREMFMNNPVDFLISSFQPPGGLTEAAGHLIMGDAQPLAERIPGIGDFIKRALKEDE